MFTSLIKLLSSLFKKFFEPLVTFTSYYMLYKLYLTIGKDKVEAAANYIMSQLNLTGMALELVGLGAWIAQTMELPATIALLGSILLVNFGLSFIRK